MTQAVAAFVAGVDSPPPPIEAVSRALAAGEFSSVDIVQACLARIERFEGRIRAWVQVDVPGALQQARRMDELQARGVSAGSLHGIPIGIKDIIDVAGMPTRAGSPLLATAPPAGRDATLVSRLRHVGAIILGKTVTTQFAGFDPPPTVNPWNLARTPGGSSSGSAAAVSLGMCLGAIGSQTGGSITRPASFCGVAGCKPTHGAVSVRGVLPLAPRLDHPGPMAASVAGLALQFAAITGWDQGDPWSSTESLAGDFWVPQTLAAPPRIGVIREFFFTEASADVVAAVERALSQLQEAGAEIVDAPLPASFDGMHAHHRRIMAVEAALYHRPWYPAQREAYGSNFRLLLEEGRSAAALDYAEAVQHQQRFRHEMTLLAREYDVLLTPAIVATAPTRDSTGDPRFNSPWSYCGLPTASLPCGLCSDGLPAAAQLAASPWSEHALLSAAAWCEQVWREDLWPDDAWPGLPL